MLQMDLGALLFINSVKFVFQTSENIQLQLSIGDMTTNMHMVVSLEIMCKVVEQRITKSVLKKGNFIHPVVDKQLASGESFRFS